MAHLHTLGKTHLHTLNALLGCKITQVQNLLQCDRETLFSLLQTLAHQAELPSLDTSTMLQLLEEILSNTALQDALKQALQQQQI
jgi:hypothetical protein